MLDGTQEFTIFQRLHELSTDRIDLVAAAEQVGEQSAESSGVNLRLALELLQGFGLLVEFLENLAAHVSAHQDGHDL